jgi:DNA helicase-2/ATP-dependent DNA helicase PcrA
MIKVVVGPKTRLLAAGDPGQCIFTWAGASLKRFDHFKDHYPKHEVHRLTRNYRSTTQILDFCNSVLNQSTLADVTKSRSKVAGLKPTVVLSPSPPNLCEYAAKEISKARDSGQPLSEIAVLYRFHNDKRILTGYLENARIPY